MYKLLILWPNNEDEIVDCTYDNFTCAVWLKKKQVLSII